MENEKKEKTVVLQEIDKDKEAKREKHKKSRFWELVRFLITGIVATLIDAGVFFVLMKFVFFSLAEQGGENGWGGYLSWGIATTISFLVSCAVNFVMSRLWVYQNVDRNINTKTPKTFWIYVGLAALGWLLGVGIQELGVLICNSAWQLNLSVNFTKVSWTDLFNEAGVAFWAFVVIFVIKTILTMIYNYLTRKLIIFKAPKEENPYGKPEGDLVVTLRGEKKETTPISKAKTNNAMTTPDSFKEIFHEEVKKTFGEEQKKIDARDGRKIVREELEEYESVHGRSKGKR